MHALCISERICQILTNVFSFPKTKYSSIFLISVNSGICLIGIKKQLLTANYINYTVQKHGDYFTFIILCI